MDSKMLTLWIAMASMGMMFMGFTSAVIVKRGEFSTWLTFELPDAFLTSTILVIASSITMWMASRAAKNNEITKLKITLSLTILLGIAFLVSQFLGYKQLVEGGIFLVGNPAGSFVYVISLVHAIHILAAIIALVVTFVASLKYKVHSKSMRGIQLSATFWHFVGILWIYLYVVLLLNR